MKNTEELAIVVGYIMYHDLFSDTRLDGSFFTKIDNVILVAKEFTKKYPYDYEWIKEDFEETLDTFVKENAESIIKNK